jgi:hypothetical protein
LFAVVAILWAAVAASAAPADQAEAQPEMRTIRLSAERTKVDAATDTAYAVGGARLEYQDIVVTANSIEANYQSRAVTAHGEVVLRQGDRTLSGSDLAFDLDKGTGRLRDIYANVDNVFYTGESVRLTPDQWVITGSTFTTCDRPHPHYKITGREVVIRPGESATFRDASVWFGRHRLFKWPRYRMSLRKGTGQSSLIPGVGMGPRDGVYTTLTPRLTPPGHRFQARLAARLTANRGLRGQLGASYSLPWGELYALASQREDYQELGETFGPEEIVLSELSVDRVPEVGIRVLPQQVGSGLTLGGRVSAGRVKEFPTDADFRRQAIDANLRTRQYRLNPVLSISEAVAARHARYGNGLGQTVVALETTLHYQASSRLSLQLGYLRRSASGETPFEFDRVQIARELRSGVDWSITPVWRVSFHGAFDTGRSRFRDADITVNKTAHCLVYSLKWRQIRREFSLGVGLAQFASD